MQLGVSDVFRLGIGPSSSHTVGPMKAGHHFAELMLTEGANPVSVQVDLYGSLAATGIGHGTDRAVLLGLGGAKPESVDTATISSLLPRVNASKELPLLGDSSVPFSVLDDLRFHPWDTLPFHVNGMVFSASFADDTELRRTYYSVGGGSVVVQDSDEEVPVPIDGDLALTDEEARPPYPFQSGTELLSYCQKEGLSVADLVRTNEEHAGDRSVEQYLDSIIDAMFAAVASGCQTEGTLPGGLRVPRRAVQLRIRLEQSLTDPMALLDWVTLYALAVNEENAAGHRVVTAPTNGAAGVVPAVLGHFLVSVVAKELGGLPALAATHPLWDLEGLLAAFPSLRPRLREFLLAATAVGSLIKTNASVAGAEVGCQGEVGSASAMASAGLAQALGGTPAQVENAAEIAMEHSLGLTCDPVGGLVQIPCIERNAIAAVKAISASRIALYGDGHHHVSLDNAIETMRQTGVDMNAKYKETSIGGLAVNVVEC